MNNTRLTLLLLLSAVIPILVLSAVLGRFFISQQEHSLDANIKTQASRSAVALGRELETQIQLLLILSESPRLDPPVAPIEFEELAKRLQNRIPIWEIIRISDLSGNLIVSVPTRDTGQAKLVDLDSYHRFVEKGEPVIGAMVRGPRGLPAFPVRVPVTRDARIVYGLTAVIRPDAVNGILHANGLSSNWSAWIVDEKGKLVAATGDNAPLIAEPAAAYFRPDGAPNDDIVDGSSKGEMLRASMANVPGSGWTVYVGMPKKERLALTRTGRILLFATSAFTLVLSVAAAVLFLRELTARRRQDAQLANWQRLDALGKLTGGVAHDFNNLLMVFQSGAEGMQRHPGDAQRLLKTTDMILEAVGRGRSMTKRLLAFSRRSNLEAEPILLQRAIPEMAPLLRQAINDRIELNFHIDPYLWPVTVDRQAFEIAFVNLVTNAREAMPDGGHIKIEAWNLSEAKTGSTLKGPCVALSITDTGIGIDSSDVKRIFEPFFSGRQSGSVGLGLSHVYDFVERSGGKIEVSSTVRQGTSFTIYLPKTPATAMLNSAPTLVGTHLPKRVLVVDDTPSSLAAARMTLENEGMEVIAATGGEEALAYLQADREIQALLTDIMMPKMTGHELAKRVRRSYPHVAIVLMTGYSEPLEDRNELAFPILEKPFARNEVLVTLLAAVERVNR